MAVVVVMALVMLLAVPEGVVVARGSHGCGC